MRTPSAKRTVCPFVGPACGLLICWLFGFFTSGSYSQQDQGSSDPILKLKDSFSDAITKAEKAIPRGQKHQILNALRHKVRSSVKASKDPTQLLALAQQYQRFRFYPEALQLYREVAENEKFEVQALMEAHRALGEIQFVANDNVSEAIFHLKKAVSYSPKKSVDRGKLLGRLATYYLVNDQTKEMLSAYAEFNLLPDSVKNATPQTYLKANLYSARFTTDSKEASRLFKKASAIAEKHSGVFPADLILSVLSESTSNTRWNSPERIEKLSLFINDEKFADTPRIQKLAMEILMAHYLECDKDWKRFERQAKSTLELLEKFNSKKGKEQTLETPALYCQALGIFVGGADENKKDWDRNDSKKDYQIWVQKIEQMQFYLPSGINRTDKQAMIKAFTRGARLLNPEPNSKRTESKEKESRK